MRCRAVSSSSHIQQNPPAGIHRQDSNLLKELTLGMASAAGFKRFDPIGEARPSSQLRHSVIMLGIVLGAVSVSLRTRGMETSMIVCSATAL